MENDINYPVVKIEKVYKRTSFPNSIMSDRKPFIAVHQGDVEEFDRLDDALKGIDGIREHYHRGIYRVYDFEVGIYQIVKEGSIPQVKLPDQSEYAVRDDDELKPFAVVDKADISEVIGMVINIPGIGNVDLSEDNLPQLAYHGFDNFNEARAEFLKRKDNEAGLYSLVAFHKVAGSDKEQ